MISINVKIKYKLNLIVLNVYFRINIINNR